MDNKGLLFIPDISGFTRFVNQTEIEHSKHIIEELLDTIINANRLGLQISEIEGDAILFYKFGDAPSISDLHSQVERMFIAFHKHLRNYENRRICQCGACCTAIDLTLKFISHSGEFTGYQVKEFKKLIGRDVILAHQLLKNDIPGHEYWLKTETLFDINDNSTGSLEWNKGEKKTDEETIPFHFTMLTPLKQNAVADPMPDISVGQNRIKMIEVENDIDDNIYVVLETIADLSLRPLWIFGVTGVDQQTQKINQVGTKHRCVLAKGGNILYTSGFSKTTDKIVFSETDEKRNRNLQLYTASYK